MANGSTDNAGSVEAQRRANLAEAVPFFSVTNIDASLRFYVDGLGFEITRRWTPRGRIEWCWLQRGSVALMLQEYRPGRRPEGALGLGVSIPYIQQIGVDNIQQYRQPMLKRLQQEMPRLGFTPATPADSTSPIVTFTCKDTREAARRLEAAKVNVRVAPYWVRIAPSIYNDLADVERLLDALS